jgi:hypothetical protein
VGVEHVYGDGNPAADMASRGRFRDLALLCAQLGVHAERVPVPAAAMAFLASVRAAFRAGRVATAAVSAASVAVRGAAAGAAALAGGLGAHHGARGGRGGGRSFGKHLATVALLALAPTGASSRGAASSATRSPVAVGNRTRCSSAPPTARVLVDTGDERRSGTLVACAPAIPATRAVLYDDARSCTGGDGGAPRADDIPTRDHRQPLTSQYTVFTRSLMSPGASLSSDSHCCYGCQRLTLDGFAASRAAFWHCVPSTRLESGFDRGRPVTGRLATAGEPFAK